MQPFNCPRCQTPNPPSASGCQKCGLQFSIQMIMKEQAAPGSSLEKKGSTALYLVLGFGVFLIIIIVIYAPRNSGTSSSVTTSPITATPPSPPSTSQPQAAQQPRPDESERLVVNAKTALADGYRPSGKDRSWGRVKDAKLYLELVRPSDKEYKQAQKLMAEVSRREKEIDAWSRVAARDVFADMLERAYLEKNMDVSLTLSGSDKTTISFKYVLMSRPLVYQLTRDADFMGKLREFGFKKIIFTDGYFHSWNIPVD